MDSDWLAEDDQEVLFLTIFNQFVRLHFHQTIAYWDLARRDPEAFFGALWLCRYVTGLDCQSQLRLKAP